MPTKKEILKLEAITKDYTAGDGSSLIHVLSETSLTVHEGGSISIEGPSGSGKSTLLNIMGTLDKPSSGKVIFNGIDVTEFSDDEVSSIRNRKIGFIFQMHHLLPQCSVIENVLIPTLPLQKNNYEEYYNRAVKLLESAGLDNRINHRPAELSGGEQLRTAVVRALINEPEILLADEPTGSLDNKTAREIIELMVNLNKSQKLALVVVTHSNELAGMMDNKYELKNSRLNQL